MPDPAQPSVLRIVAMAAPAAAAIAVFGVLYGAAARPLIGPELTMISSIIVFSGATQFTTIGLVAAGAGGPAILATVALLNVRHLMMGAVHAVVTRALAPEARAARLVPAGRELRLHGGGSRSRAARSGAGRTSPSARCWSPVVCCYGAWLAGTALGLLGAGVQGPRGGVDRPLPGAVHRAGGAYGADAEPGRARAGGGGITAVIAFMLPDWSALAPVVSGLLVAIPNDPKAGPDR